MLLLLAGMIRRTAFITLLLLSLTLQPAYCRILSEYNSEFTSDLLPIGPLLPPRSKDPPSEPLSKDGRGDAPPAQDGEDKTFIIDKGVCLTSSNMFNETLCRQLDRRVRTFTCTDIGPIEGVDCSIPYIVDRCDSIWMWKEAFCLKSCGRCGKEGCTDVPPPGASSCDFSQCDSPEYLQDGSPYCLATCRRCSYTNVE